MELFSAEFFSALLAIIVIDLVLAGDNAIVIALAARNLPAKEKNRAIIFGTAGAIIVRSIMTLGVVWLLKIPGLMLIGGLMLFWIAVKLIAPAEELQEHSPAATTFWGAMKTIIIADAVMGVDNVLAVAGAAHGSFLLVVLGLLISIPIVVWGSKLVLKLIERHPSVIYVGGGVLALTAAKMVLNEPVLDPWVDSLSPVVYWGIIALSVAGVIYFGVWLKRRHGGGGFSTTTESTEDTARATAVRESSADANALSASAGSAAMSAATGPAPDGTSESGPQAEKSAPDRVLLAVNDSVQAAEAARHLARMPAGLRHREIHLVYAAPFLPIHVGKFLSATVRHQAATDRAREIYDVVRKAFAASSVQIIEHELQSVSPGKAISRLAKTLGCSRIVIGTRRESSLVRLFSNSVTSGLLSHATVPVEIVSRGEAPGWVRFGLPAGLSALLALLIAD